ncbi:MAG: hypothetical protein KKF77_02940 [Proteobacteria bacterium]|nr:hypothetical protein [Pseudomonadota bacterium]
MAHRIDGQGATLDGLFTEGDPAGGIPATEVTAAWTNMVQEEVAAVVEGAGGTLDKEDNTQLRRAILAYIGASSIWSSAKDYTVPSMVFGSDGKLYLALLASGPGGAGAKDPTSQPTYWLDYAASITPSGPTVDEGYIDGGSITPGITDGAALAVVEDGTNDLTRNALSFPGVVKDTHGFFNFRAPSNWDGETIRAKVLCKGTTGCSAGDDIRFYLACAAVAPGENLDVALGTAVTMDGDVVDAGKLIETTASAAMTPSGTPAAGDLLRFRLSRDYDYGAQPMAEPAELVGIVLQFGVTGNIAAWA